MSDPQERPAEAAPEKSGPGLPQIDVNERGGKRDGVAQAVNRRLFMQLLVYGVPPERDPHETGGMVARALERNGVAGVIYDDVNDPRGLGVLTWSDQPTHFVTRVRPALNEPSLRTLILRPSFTMLGRSYSSGHEPRLEWSLLDRPREMVTNTAYPWAVWYPLRRNGAFAKLEHQEQVGILREHASIGMAYGAQELAHDIRLACHGIDAHDNEFVIGLVGPELHPLSHLVQTMRKTRQTSEFIQQMGPFFVGHVAHRSVGV